MNPPDQPTPRTNAEIKSEPYTRFEQLLIDRSVPAQFARTLERELTAMTARAERAEATLAEAKIERETVAEASLRSLEAYIDKLKQFAERAEKAEAELAAIKRGHGELGKYEQLRLKNAQLYNIIDRASTQFFHEGTDGEILTNMLTILNEAK